MILSVVWLTQAAAELHEAVHWYTNISPPLGLRFGRAVEETVKTIAETPFLFAVVSEERRRAGIRRFPYGLYFLVEERRIVIIACFHGKRDPARWQQRKPS